MTTAPPLVSAIVVTFRSADWIGDCLRSVLQHGGPVEIIVVDNGSDDDTVARVRATTPAAQVIPLPGNRGFGPAANLGAAAAHGDRLLFLNPDARLLEITLPPLLAHLEDHPDVALAGPRLVYPDGHPQDAAFTYPSLLMTWLEFFPWPGRLLHGRLNGRISSTDGLPVRADHPLGACMLARRAAWEDVGGFDEAFFLYCEEVDWCMRAQQRGWTIAHVPQAVAVHQGGASAATAPGASLVHLYQSRLLLHRKYRPVWFRIAARFITCLGLAQESRRDRTSPRGHGAAERTHALERAMHLAHR